ncbi:MAG: hypothetical protein GKS02_02910 [Alphaproteobacteria bacterium]|nr:hypothetical protein [Alphaproteobacteria bacterium]
MFNAPAKQNSSFPTSLLFTVVPLVAFAAVAFPLSDWIVDDALISFAYARNLADGAGFVSQPGKVPVEGFSNPLWTLLFVPGFWLNAQVPILYAKLLGHLFSFATLFFGFHIVLRITGSRLFSCLAMTFLALNTAFVVWNVSGLENALYAFEIMALAYLCIVSLDRLSWRIALMAGLLAAAATLTRPDGIVFAALWPAALFVRSVRDWSLAKGTVGSSVAYIGAFAAPVGAYKSMALIYFGSLLPNTYYAKGTPGLSRLWDILRLEEAVIEKALSLFAGPFGFAWFTIGALGVTFILCLVARRSVAPLVFLTGATFLAFLAFIVLPNDWMPEFRFGTPFTVLFYPTLFSLIWVVGDAFLRSRLYSQQFPAFAIVAVLAVASILVHQFRFERFYDEPTVPFTDISKRYGERYNKAAAALGVEDPSFLLQDVGATLFFTELEIFDLAGLTDGTVARTLWKDKPALRDYIFNEVKPTIIHTYAYSALEADLDASAQFREQYIPLREAVDEIASEAAGRTIYSGDYVRRDVVENRPEALSQARTALYGPPGAKR